MIPILKHAVYKTIDIPSYISPTTQEIKSNSKSTINLLGQFTKNYQEPVGCPSNTVNVNFEQVSSTALVCRLYRSMNMNCILIPYLHEKPIRQWHGNIKMKRII